MRVYKYFDAFVSLFLILFFGIRYLYNNSYDTLIAGYIITGAWQGLSMGIHASEKWFTRKYSWRNVYHWIALISVITLPLGSFWILFFTAPWMAIFYTILCFTECLVKIRRPLSLIKN